MRAGERLALLRASGLAPKKSFGQNFLVSDGAIERIAEACVPDAEVGATRVLELGAGLGALTAALVARAGHVVAVERDRDIVPLLRDSMASAIEAGTLVVVEEDAQRVSLEEVLGPPGVTRVLAGNLPYQITGQLLRLAVEQAKAVDRVVFMLQREVAERLVAEPATKAYGALTVFVRAAFRVRLILDVPPEAFVPRPAVSSAVVVLEPHRPPLADETETFRALVKAAFGARRKTLRNAWRGIAELGVLEAAAVTAGVSLDARGETLDVGAYDRMARALR